MKQFAIIFAVFIFGIILGVGLFIGGAYAYKHQIEYHVDNGPIDFNPGP